MQDRPTTLGQLIRRRRSELQLSFSDLEAATGIRRSRLSEVERGQRRLSPPLLVPLASALQVPLADLYEAAGYPLPQHLPSIRPYLRRAYQIPEAAVDEIERYLLEHSPGFMPGVGPNYGEDEFEEDNQPMNERR